MTLTLQSVLTCPHCDFSEELTMQTDACQFFYLCSNCQERMRPKVGDCCVFCSYGSVPCPPMQQATPCCSSVTLLIP